MQLKHNVGACTHIHNPKCYCSTAAQLWSNLNSESILGGNLKHPVCLVLLQRVNPQSQQPQVLHSRSWPGTFSLHFYWWDQVSSRCFSSSACKRGFIAYMLSKSASYKPVDPGSVQKAVVGFSLHFLKCDWTKEIKVKLLFFYRSYFQDTESPGWFSSSVWRS